MFSQSAWELACYPQLEQKNAEMERLLAANPKDPLGLSTRGELLLDDGKTEGGDRGLQGIGEEQPSAREAAAACARSSTSRTPNCIRNDFTPGEPYLDEYKALCDDPGRRRPSRPRKRSGARTRPIAASGSTCTCSPAAAKGRGGSAKRSTTTSRWPTWARAKTLLEMPDEPNVPDAARRVGPRPDRGDDPPRRPTRPPGSRSKTASTRNGTRSRTQQRPQEAPRVRRRLRPVLRQPAPRPSSCSPTSSWKPTTRPTPARRRRTSRNSASPPRTRSSAPAPPRPWLASWSRTSMMEDAVGAVPATRQGVPRRRHPRRQDRRRLHDQPADRQAAAAVPGAEPLPDADADEGRAANEPVANVHYNGQFESRTAAAICSRCTAASASSSTSTTSGNGTWTVAGLRSRHRPSRRRSSRTWLAPHGVNSGSLAVLEVRAGQRPDRCSCNSGTWVYCFDLAEKKERWQKNLLGDPGHASNPQAPIPARSARTAKSRPVR